MLSCIPKLWCDFKITFSPLYMPSVARRATLCFVPTSSTYPMWSKVVSPLGFHWNKHKAFHELLFICTEVVKLNERQSQTFQKTDLFGSHFLLFFFIFKEFVYGMSIWYFHHYYWQLVLCLNVTYCFWHLKSIFELPF